MLSRPELLVVFLAQPADNGKCAQLRLRGEPTLDRSSMWIRGMRHEARCLSASCRAPWQIGCGRWRVACTGALQAARLSGTPVDTIAELILGCANPGQEPDWIDRAILIA